MSISLLDPVDVVATGLPGILLLSASNRTGFRLVESESNPIGFATVKHKAARLGLETVTDEPRYRINHEPITSTGLPANEKHSVMLLDCIGVSQVRPGARFSLTPDNAGPKISQVVLTPLFNAAL